MDNLVSILKMPGLNMDVKNKILRHVQNWALSFEAKPVLHYVPQVYKELKSEGAPFASICQLLPRLTVVQVLISLPRTPPPSAAPW